MEKGKPEAGYGDMPPPYSIGQGQPAYSGQPPVYMVNTPHNAVPMPPPGAGYATPQGLYTQQTPYATQNSTVVSVVQFSNLRGRSTRMVCPHCRSDVSTRINYKHGRFTFIAALVGCLICCPFGLIPFCVDECQDVEHFCPNCQQYIGIYRR